MDKIEEGVYLKKDWSGYRVIHPVKNEDGSWNWWNICTGGTWWNLCKWIAITLLILLMCLTYYRDVKVCRDFLDSPYQNCVNYIRGVDSDRGLGYGGGEYTNTLRKISEEGFKVNITDNGT